MKTYRGLFCNHCEDVIYSKYRHDFVECTCGKIFVDGGQDYFRFGGIVFLFIYTHSRIHFCKFGSLWCIERQHSFDEHMFYFSFNKKTDYRAICSIDHLKNLLETSNIYCRCKLKL